MEEGADGGCPDPQERRGNHGPRPVRSGQKEQEDGLVLAIHLPGPTPVAFLVHGLDDASVRYRLKQFIAPLRDLRFDLHLFPIPKDPSRRLELFRTLRRYALVGIQRKLFSAGFLHILRRCARRLVYDFDDALYIRDSRENSRRSWQREGRFARTVRLADLVIAGSEHLAEAARPLGGPVHVLPTCIDVDRYTALPRRGRNGSAVTIGWIGSRSTLFYLEDLAPVLDGISTPGLPKMRLKIIADAFIQLDRMAVIRKQWVEAEEVEDLADVDIGIMPLRDDLWSRGKCGLKILQYMAMGIPVVCTPVGTNLDLVSDGKEGFHARDREEWIRVIRRLAVDGVLRREMGDAGRRRIQAGYSAASAAPRLAEILRFACQ